MVDILRPTYNDIHSACETWVSNINKMNVVVDRVIGVSRGGLIPGVIVSHLLDKPFTPITYSSKSGAGDNKNHSNMLVDVDDVHLLIVDDICDTSLTLREIVDYYNKQKKVVNTAVLHYKTRKDTKIIPDFYTWKIPEDSDWVIYPFEKV